VLLACSAGEGNEAPLEATSPPAPPTSEAATQSQPPASPEPAGVVVPGGMPRGYRARGDEAAKLNATCAGCHPNEAREWRGSHHQRAFENPAFQDALALEPTGFCRGCHAPEADAESPPSPALADLGVGCVTCHVTTEGEVLASARDGDRLEPMAGGPHAVRYSTEFAGAGACASCHEFGFPGARGEHDARFMQTTIREHARSPASFRSCASCHMPSREGGRVHSFASVRDPNWLRASIDASARATDYGTVIVTLVQTQPGHAFPTGDLFRRIEVGAERRGSGGEPRVRRTRHLARHFEVQPGNPGRVLTRDDRVFFEPVEVELDVGCDDGAPGEVDWWVTYQRVAQTGDGLRPEEAEIESAVRLHGGELCGGKPTP
jgi:hypothetical protein